MEQLQRYAKLSYRVVFPFELRLFNTVSTNLYCTVAPLAQGNISLHQLNVLLQREFQLKLNTSEAKFFRLSKYLVYLSRGRYFA